MPKSTLSVPVVECGLIDQNGEVAPFCIVFYGIPKSEFMVTPGGGGRIIAALERRGLLGQYVSSPFLIRERRYPNARR